MLAAWSTWLVGRSTWLLLPLVGLAIAALSYSADKLVDAVVLLARRLGVSPLIIGATLVSIGTTAPEVAVSVVAAYAGEGGLALGNGIGSIIVDTGLIMGLVLLLGRQPLRGRALVHANRWRELAVMLLSLLLLAAVVLWPRNGVFPRLFGWMLVAGLVGYLASSVLRASRDTEARDMAVQVRVLPTVFILVGSLLLLLVASRVLVDSAVVLAQRWRVPQSIIAVSLVAFGTSVPELSTAVAAIRKGHTDLALGNVFGADVLNALLVVGASAALVPLSFDRFFLTLHAPVMLLMVLPFRLFVLWARRRSVAWRVHGLYLLLIYLVYLGMLVRDSVSLRAHAL